MTKKDHLLTPGIVRRWITEDKDTITVHTYGEGVGPLGLANEWFDDPVWTVADKQIMEFARNR